MPMWLCPHRELKPHLHGATAARRRRGRLSIRHRLCMLDRMHALLFRPIVAAVALSTLLVACTNDDGSSSSPASSVSTSTGPSTKLTKPNAPLEVSIGAMKGGVEKQRRDGIRKAAAKPIESWMQAAFLAGKYPHSSFPGAYAGWTAQAAQFAMRDKGVTTNAALGKDLIGLVADQRTARLYVFADRGVTGGTTANVRMMLTGEKSNGNLTKFVISGKLYLTRKENTWRIFGYDLDRAVVR